MYLKRVWLAFVVALFSGLIYWPQNSSATLLEYSFSGFTRTSFGDIEANRPISGSMTINLNAPLVISVNPRQAVYDALSDVRVNVDGKRVFTDRGIVTLNDDLGAAPPQNMPLNDTMGFQMSITDGNITGDPVLGFPPISFGFSFIGPASLFSGIEFPSALQAVFGMHDELFNIGSVLYRDLTNVIPGVFGSVEFRIRTFSVRELPAPSPIPLPATAWLFLPALLGLAALRLSNR